MMKLVVHDGNSAAGLSLTGFSHMREVVRVLRGLEESDSASVLLESFARRCLEAGLAFESTDPQTACTVCGSLVEVEVHAEPGAPVVHFVRLYRRDPGGVLCRLNHGTLHAVARQLRCEEGSPFPVPSLAALSPLGRSA